MQQKQSIYGSNSMDTTGHNVPTIPAPNMLHIIQTSPYVNASITALPSMSGTQTLNQDAIINYELSYFQFPQEPQLDIGDGMVDMAIQVWLAPALTDWTTQYATIMGYRGLGLFPYIPGAPSVTQALGPVWFSLKIPAYTEQTQTYNCHEIANYLTEQMLQYAYQNRMLPSGTVNRDKAMWATIFFYHFQDIIYSEQYQKFVVRLSTSTQNDIYTNLAYTDVSGTSQILSGNYSVQHIDIQLRIKKPTLRTSINLARLMGINQYDIRDVYYDSNVAVSAIVNDLSLPQTVNGFQSTLIRALQYSKFGASTAPPATYAETNNTQTIDYILPNVPRQFYEEFVYVRTSTNSPGVVIYEGQITQNNILAILPRTVGYGRLVTLNEMYIQRPLSMPDTLASIKTLKLVLTDVYGTPLSFTEPFRLGILIKPYKCMPTAADIGKELKKY